MNDASRRAALGLGIMLALGVVALWPVEKATFEREPDPAEDAVRTPSPSLTAAAAPRAPAPLPQAESAVPAPEPQPLAAESGEAQHPHPITREHEVLQQELRLVGALQDALDMEDVPALRSLIARYRAHVPGDENKLAEGYTRLADCLEVAARGADLVAVRAAAQAYYENERASTLRRYIRRICLER